VFDQATANLLNSPAAPDYWVWKSNLSVEETGMAIVMSEVGGLTTANSTRLQVSFQVRPGGFTPSDASDRSLFGSVFSAAGGQLTRAALLLKWQRLATVAEKLFATGGGGTQATGLGTDGSVTGGSPANFGPGAEGNVTVDDLIKAANS
jgi:hypothetical protein